MCSNVYAKRAVPASVEPITSKNMIFSAPAFIAGESQNGGFVEARNKDSGKLVWRVRVYRTEYSPSLERDAQDVHIVSLRLSNGSIVVTDEKGRVFKVD